MNILIIRLSSIGDIVHLLPSIHLLRQNFLDANISWVVCNKAYELLENNNLVNDVYRLSNNFPKSIYKDYNTLRKISNIKWDIIIDYHNYLKTIILRFFLSGPIYTFPYDNCCYFEQKLGYYLANYTCNKFNDQNKVLKNIYLTRFVIKKNSQLLKNDLNLNDFRFNSDSNKAINWIKLNNLDSFITLCVNCSGKSRMWNKNNWVKLIKKLKKKNFKIVLLGSDYSDDGIFIKNKFRYDEKIYISPLLTLKESCDILKKTKLYIGVDSCILHIANYLSVKTLGLFGPTCAKYNGLYYSNFNYLQKNSTADFYNHKNLKDLNCINTISVTDVYNKIIDLII